MASTLENQDTDRIELRDRVMQLASKFKGYYTLLFGRNPDTNRLHFLEWDGARPFGKKKMSEIQDDFEDVSDILKGISFILPMDSSEAKEADDRFRELKIEWLDLCRNDTTRTEPVEIVAIIRELFAEPLYGVQKVLRIEGFLNLEQPLPARTRRLQTVAMLKSRAGDG